MEKNTIVIFLIFICFLSCNKTPKKSIKVTIEDKTVDDVSFVKIPKGEYTYGINDEIKIIDYDYWIMKYEVTNKQYYNFLIEALYNNFLQINGDTIVWNYPGDDLRPKKRYSAKILDQRIYLNGDSLHIDTAYSEHPVTELTWFGAVAFCKWYHFLLPDQFEWEKAARGNTGFNYPWGNSLESNRANYHDSGDPYDNGTTPIGFYNGKKYGNYQTKDSPSPYGCYDMAGNAWEYTNSNIFPNLPFVEGGGGGYLYHTGAMTQSWFRSYFGYPIQSRADRPFESDGCRCITK